MCKEKDWIGKDLHPNVLERKELIREIAKAVTDGKLDEPFYPHGINDILIFL